MAVVPTSTKTGCHLGFRWVPALMLTFQTVALERIVVHLAIKSNLCYTFKMPLVRLWVFEY